MYLWTRKFSLNFVSLIRDPNPDSECGLWIRTGFATAELCALPSALVGFVFLRILVYRFNGFEKKKITCRGLRAVVRWLLCF